MSEDCIHVSVNVAIEVRLPVPKGITTKQFALLLKKSTLAKMNVAYGITSKELLPMCENWLKHHTHLTLHSFDAYEVL